MAHNRWKYATVGLGSLVGAGIIFYMVVFVIPFLTASTNNQPNTLEGIPDEWAAHTWANGQQEATYGSRVADCSLSIAKGGSPDHPVNLTVSLSCDGDEDGSTHSVSRSDNAGGGEHMFITEPAGFEFDQPEADSCHMSFNYGSFRWEEGVEEIKIHISCEEQE